MGQNSFFTQIQVLTGILFIAYLIIFAGCGQKESESSLEFSTGFAVLKIKALPNQNITWCRTTSSIASSEAKNRVSKTYPGLLEDTAEGVPLKSGVVELIPVCCADLITNNVLTSRFCADYNRTTSVLEMYDIKTGKLQSRTITKQGCKTSYDFAGRELGKSCQ